jgi:O-methyltransferase
MNRILRSLRYRLGNARRSRTSSEAPLPSDFDGDFAPLYASSAPFTMTSAERMFALYKAIEYVEAANIPGDIVECGVWRGGSSRLAAATLMALGSSHRTLHLFDTFEGMPAPSAADVQHSTGEPAANILDRSEREADVNNEWAYAPLSGVQATLAETAYPRVEFVQGRVEDTLPAAAPREIAVLRLDTDWYESTRHELEHLYPRLVDGGVLIIDDYGYWQGARKAVDEYFGTTGEPILLNRIDDTGRIAIKRG